MRLTARTTAARNRGRRSFGDVDEVVRRSDCTVLYTVRVDLSTAHLVIEIVLA